MEDAGRASAPAAVTVTVSVSAAPAPPPPSATTTAAADTSSPDPSVLYEEGMWHQMAMDSGATMQPEPYPERPGEPDCTYYLRTGLCRFGMSCRFNHPPDRNLAIASARMKGEYPEREGHPECQYYLKTGTCKFGPTCKFHHPREKAGIAGRVQLNTLGYPLRPNEKECAYYLKTGQCKYGDTCKFHHPELFNEMASSRGSPVYPSVHSSARAGPHSYTGTVASWAFPRASFIPSPRWQSPSNYAPMIVPQGLVQVPSWNSYPSQLQSPGAQQTYGTSQQGEGSAGNQGMLSPYRSSSYPVPQYALQRENVFPERPDQPECQYYMKTGDCKFGAVCKFHHPRVRMLPPPDCVLSPIGLPLRPGEELCKFYSRYGICKFGANCNQSTNTSAPPPRLVAAARTGPRIAACSAASYCMGTGDGPPLQSLLCLAWIAATFPIVAAALPIPAAGGGRLLHRLLAAFSSRGKTTRPSSSSSSSSSKEKFTVPQKFFLHFYVVGVIVTTVLLVEIWFYAYMKMTPLSTEPSSYSAITSHILGGSNSFSLSNFLSSPKEHKYRVWRTVFVLLLMEVQVLRRLYETEYVFYYSPSARMHIVGYLTGLFYYVATPLSLASSCIPQAMQYLRGQVTEFIVKGRARMPDLVIDSSSLLKPLVKLGWCQWIGAVIFIWGSLHQIRCHAILGSLRKHRDSDEYVIPCGDWFDRVSCPHYLAELVIYFGMLVASGGSNIPVWFMFLFVIANLSFAAVQTHKWYLQKFEDYPRYRYAIIPFVC